MLRQLGISSQVAFRVSSPSCRITLLLVAALCGGSSTPAFAEGRCPLGSYPIGGQGVGGCAPVAGGPSSAVPRATGRWHTRWGAIAIAASNGDVGVSTDKASKREAEREAISACQQGGARDCRSEMNYKNQCVAAAKAVGYPVGNIRTGASEEQARERALGRCEAGGVNCSITYVGCSKPWFEYY